MEQFRGGSVLPQHPLLAVGRRGEKGSWRWGRLSPGEEVAVLRLLAGLSWPPALPPLTVSSFVPHFTAFSSRARRQTPSRTAPPACHYRLGR